MIRRLLLLLLRVGLVAMAAVPPAAFAEETSEELAKAMVGAWEFSNADRDRRCMITFKTEPAAAGMKLEFDKGCAEVFPFIKDVAGWTIAPNDFLKLVDAKGVAILEFSEVESGMYEAPRPGEGILFIQTAAAVAPAPPATEQMAGEWTMLRGAAAKPICALTLSTRPAGPDALALKLGPGCDASVLRFGPANWRMDRGELVLGSAKGETWRFEESNPRTWQRVPEQVEPVVLVKR